MKSIHEHNVDEYRSVYKTDHAAKSYEVQNKVDVLKRLIPQLNTNDSVLEIGFGTGDLLHELSKKNQYTSFTGVEIVKEALQLYRKRFPRDKNVHLVLGDAEKELVVKKRVFSVIILSHIIEHLNNEDKFLKGIFKILKENGSMVIAVPDWGQSSLHYRQYNEAALRKIAKKHNLNLILLRGDGFYINKLFYKLLSIAGITGKEDHAGESHCSPEGPEKKTFIKNIYYSYVVKLLLFMNRLDSALCGKIDNRPIQWIAIYRKFK